MELLVRTMRKKNVPIAQLVFIEEHLKEIYNILCYHYHMFLFSLSDLKIFERIRIFRIFQSLYLYNPMS